MFTWPMPNQRATAWRESGIASVTASATASTAAAAATTRFGPEDGRWGNHLAPRKPGSGVPILSRATATGSAVGSASWSPRSRRAATTLSVPVALGSGVWCSGIALPGAGAELGHQLAQALQAPRCPGLHGPSGLPQQRRGLGLVEAHEVAAGDPVPVALGERCQR